MTVLMPITVSILQAIRNWRALGRRQRVWLVMFVGILPLVRLSLRTRGFARTLSWVDRCTVQAGARLPSQHDLLAANELALLAQVAGRRGVAKVNCLPQALAVYGAIRRRGLAPSLRIGVRKTGATFEAHAWVELGGHPLAQPELDYKPMPLCQSPQKPI